MNSVRERIHKNANNSNLVSSRNSSKGSLISKPLVVSKPATSPSNRMMTSRQPSVTPLSKQRSISIKNKSTFKLYVGQGKRDASKSINQKDSSLKESEKQNIHPNITINKPVNDRQKGRTLREVRLGISKPEQKQIKNELKIVERNQSQAKIKVVNTLNNGSSSKKSMLDYIPREIVEDYKKVSLQDFIILRQIEELQLSNQYLVLHKRLNCLFNLKKFNKNQVNQQERAHQLSESIKIHLYLSQHNHFACFQRLFMIFHDATSTYLVLEPFIPSQSKRQTNFSAKNTEELVRSHSKLVQDVCNAHEAGVIIRNISSKTAKTYMGVAKLTNIIQAARFSIRKRRQSFLGNLYQAPHEVTMGMQYDSSYDMWSFGLLLYELIMGFSPFEGEYAMTLIKNLEYSLPITLSNEVACLISSLLCEKSKRLSATQCLSLSIFSQQPKQGTMLTRQLHTFWSLQ